MYIEQKISEFEEAKIPQEGQGSLIFRENASYVWTHLKDVVLELNEYARQANGMGSTTDGRVIGSGQDFIDAFNFAESDNNEV